MTNQQRKECAALHRSGKLTQAQLAERYGVCKKTIQCVLREQRSGRSKK